MHRHIAIGGQDLTEFIPHRVGDQPFASTDLDQRHSPTGRGATRTGVTPAECSYPPGEPDCRAGDRSPRPVARPRNGVSPKGTTGPDGTAVTRDFSGQVLTPTAATIQIGQFGTPSTASARCLSPLHSGGYSLSAFYQ